MASGFMYTPQLYDCFLINLNYISSNGFRRKHMIEKVVRKRNLTTHSQAKEDLAYWLSRPAEERVLAVEYLRRQHHGSTGRLQRVARVIKRT